MEYTVVPTEKFDSDVKHYIKKKKFYKIGNDIKRITDELEKGNLIGNPITDIDVNNKTYKVRSANSDTNSGQSNGYRIIYYAITEALEIYLLTIYYKKDDNKILSNQQIQQLIEQYCDT